ncbi:nucleoside hydrolase [Flavimaricola marinus]|uniref:Pyrimidine-specific ribonucleoside hydrolase RihA n=1 Tax=Flavimaricola marinus TaxID=1819565 RepID=A0A238LCK2_9RHOB|nr:nucleoside hydrolase [Flavimaricola marinus]SMY07134.1 Pyrimidine-specific ribonucleoside hydrolase RihA [Flavimaricola marinus]
MTRNPLILDTDGGVDDAQALLMLLAHGITPLAITTVFGNVSLEAATRNILDVLSLAKADVPVHMGQSRPLTGAVIDARNIHGEDGLGSAPRPVKAADPSERDGVEFLVTTLSAAARTGTKIDLLMIGPLTNLALALRMAPMISDGIGQLTIMGGTLFGRGNTTPAAEFNIYADPEAAAIVFAADIPTVVAAWEVCSAHAMESDAIDALIEALPGTPLAEFSAHLMLHARKVSFSYGGDGHFRFVDPLAAAAVIEPGLITAVQTHSVDVALAPGLTRGMTLVDPSGRLGTPPVTFIETADIDRLCALFAASAHWTP